MNGKGGKVRTLRVHATVLQQELKNVLELHTSEPKNTPDQEKYGIDVALK